MQSNHNENYHIILHRPRSLPIKNLEFKRFSSGWILYCVLLWWNECTTLSQLDRYWLLLICNNKSSDCSPVGLFNVNEFHTVQNLSVCWTHEQTCTSPKMSQFHFSIAGWIEGAFRKHEIRPEYRVELRGNAFYEEATLFQKRRWMDFKQKEKKEFEFDIWKHHTFHWAPFLAKRLGTGNHKYAARVTLSANYSLFPIISLSFFSTPLKTILNSHSIHPKSVIKTLKVT